VPAHGDAGIHVALAPETLGHFLGLPITNTLITTWITIILMVIVAVAVGRKVALIPGRLQSALEALFEFVLDQMENILESREMARKFFPFIVTIFLFIAVANTLHFVPGIGSIQYDHMPLLRSVNTDLNATLAITIIAFFVIEITGMVTIGFFRYAGKFINFKSVLGFVVGLIELMSEMIRLVSFSFRLFGNIFAGEVLIAVVTYFVPYALPVPLMAFEVFVGIVQALIFALLTLLFIRMAIVEPH
jgi:F-type H+-transporting ATPase subunit a